MQEARITSTYSSMMIARFMGPTWGPPGADRTLVGPMLAPWTLLSGLSSRIFEIRSYDSSSWHVYGARTYFWINRCHGTRARIGLISTWCSEHRADCGPVTTCLQGFELWMIYTQYEYTLSTELQCCDMTLEPDMPCRFSENSSSSLCHCHSDLTILRDCLTNSTGWCGCNFEFTTTKHVYFIISRYRLR